MKKRDLQNKAGHHNLEMNTQVYCKTCWTLKSQNHIITQKQTHTHDRHNHIESNSKHGDQGKIEAAVSDILRLVFAHYLHFPGNKALSIIFTVSSVCIHVDSVYSLHTAWHGLPSPPVNTLGHRLGITNTHFQPQHEEYPIFCPCQNTQLWYWKHWEHWALVWRCQMITGLLSCAGAQLRLEELCDLLWDCHMFPVGHMFTVNKAMRIHIAGAAYQVKIWPRLHV